MRYAVVSDTGEVTSFDDVDDLRHYVKALPPTHAQRVEKAEEELEDASDEVLRLERRLADLQEDLDDARKLRSERQTKLLAIRQGHKTDAAELIAYWFYLPEHKPHIWDAIDMIGETGSWFCPYIGISVGNKHGKLDTTPFEQRFYDSYADEQELQRLIDDMRLAIVWDKE